MENTKEIVVPEGMAKKEWFRTPEFANGVGMTAHAVNQWIHRHPEFAQKYCQNISTNPERKKWLILWEGVSVFLAIHNGRTGNQYRSKATLTRAFEEAKENVAQKANEAIKMATMQPTTPIQALLQAVQQMADMEARFQKTEQKVVMLEERLEEATNVLTTPIPVTAGQRQFLNDRVRKYCIEHELPYHTIWRQIHDHVGVIAVHKYELKHYQAALKYLEKMYIETGLIW